MGTQIDPSLKEQIAGGRWFSLSRVFNDRLQRPSLYLQLGFPCVLRPPHELPSTDFQDLIAVRGIVEGETPLAVLDDFEGRSLASILERGVPEKEVSLSILRELALALDYLHACGLVHGALKPASILIGEGSSIRIVDWMVGWSAVPLRYLSDGAEYLAPEHLAIDELGPRADQFSLGVISHQLLAGRHPFPGGLAEQLFRIRYGLPGEAVLGDTGIASHVVYDRVFSTDPAERFDSCASMVEELQKLPRRRAYSETRLEETEDNSPVEIEAGNLHPIEIAEVFPQSLSRWWIAAAFLALFAFGLGVLNWYTQARLVQIAAQNERLADINSSGNLQDGEFKVCNTSPNPLEIRELAVAYERPNKTLSVFSSSADPQMRWSVAPGSSQLLTWPAGGKAAWDGSVLFYFARVQQGQKEFIVSGHWSGNNTQDCLHLDL